MNRVVPAIRSPWQLLRAAHSFNLTTGQLLAGKCGAAEELKTGDSESWGGPAVRLVHIAAGHCQNPQSLNCKVPQLSPADVRTMSSSVAAVLPLNIDTINPKVSVCMFSTCPHRTLHLHHHVSSAPHVPAQYEWHLDLETFFLAK